MDSLISYYDELLQRFGVNDPRALAWRKDNSQDIRFKVLAEVGDLEGASILDVGCGLGDLYAYIRAKGASVKYKGIDINPRLVEAGQQKYPGLALKVVDFNSYQGEKVDYVLASGSLTFNIPYAKDVYFTQIARMFALARKAVAFNMLDGQFFEGDELYVTYTIPEVYDLCAQLTNKFVIRHEYSPEDFTFYLYK